MSVSFDFSDKVVLITGGATGIGRATAQAFATAGAKVVIGDIDDRAAETVKLITDAGGPASFIKTDVTNDDSVKSLVEAAVAEHGTIDIAFNKAGVLPPIAPLHEQTVEDWHRTLNVDATGVFLAMKHRIPVMLKAGKGSIVNTASIAGVTAGPDMTPYVPAKHAVVGLSKGGCTRLRGQGHPGQHSGTGPDSNSDDRALAERPRDRAARARRFADRSCGGARGSGGDGPVPVV